MSGEVPRINQELQHRKKEEIIGLKKKNNKKEKKTLARKKGKRKISQAIEKSRNGDTLGPVELIVWPKQGNQGD